MARSRNIKPGFFINDDLAEIDPLGRLLFIGLWTAADREGRLEDKPKRIKAELLPYDQCDADELLQALADKGFIVRYEIEGLRYIQITKFKKHQNPHKDEKPSIIRAQSMHNESTIEAPCNNDAEAMEEQETHSTNRADSFDLIPDSFNLIPDSKTHSSKRERFDPTRIVDLYHSLCPSLPKVVKITDQRKSAIKSALTKYGEQDIDTVFSKAEDSDFLTGRSGGDRNWSCGFDWLLKPANTVKVLEGIYDNKKQAAVNGGGAGYGSNAKHAAADSKPSKFAGFDASQHQFRSDG